MKISVNSQCDITHSNVSDKFIAPLNSGTASSVISPTPMRNGRSLDYAAEAYDIFRKQGIKSLIGKDRDTPPVTWLGKILDWIIGIENEILTDNVEENNIASDKENLICKTIEIIDKRSDKKANTCTVALRIFRTSKAGYESDYKNCERIAVPIISQFSKCLENQLYTTTFSNKKFTVYFLSKTDFKPSLAMDVHGLDEFMLETMTDRCQVFSLPRQLRIRKEDLSEEGKMQKSDEDSSMDTAILVVAIGLPVLGGITALTATFISMRLGMECSVH